MEDSAEVVRFMELYGSVVRYAGMMAGFAPTLLAEDLDSRELKSLKENIAKYRENVPSSVQNMMTLKPSDLGILERECDRVLALG